VPYGHDGRLEKERLIMVAALTPTIRELTTDDLVEAGFTSQQIENLVALRDRYPYMEFTESGKQWNHLKFVKWRFTNGDLARR
jgi:hypothetical protein